MERFNNTYWFCSLKHKLEFIRNNKLKKGPIPKPKPKPKIFVTEVKKGQKTYIFVVERKKCANCGYKYLIKNNGHTCSKGVTFVNIAVNRRLWFCRKSCKQEFVTM